MLINFSFLFYGRNFKKSKCFVLTLNHTHIYACEVVTLTPTKIERESKLNVKESFIQKCFLF